MMDDMRGEREDKKPSIAGRGERTESVEYRSEILREEEHCGPA